MIAASFWSLLSPAIDAVEIQNELGLSNLPSFLPPAIGFFLGALFMFILDKTIPHLHIFGKIEEAEGPKTDLKKTSLLVLAIAIHNIPEGLAVGVAFGALASPEYSSVFTLGSAVALLIGIVIYKGVESYGEDKPWFSELSEKIQSFGFSGTQEDDWGEGTKDIEEETPVNLENYAEKFDEWRIGKDAVSAPFISAGDKISKFSFNSDGMYKVRLWMFLILVPLLIWIIMWDIVSWPFLIWFIFWFCKLYTVAIIFCFCIIKAGKLSVMLDLQ